MKTENWIHGWLKSIWKKRKVVPDYRSITKEVEFNKSGVPKKHPFRDREFDGAFKESSEINEYGDDDWANPEEVEN